VIDLFSQQFVVDDLDALVKVAYLSQQPRDIGIPVTCKATPAHGKVVVVRHGMSPWCAGDVDRRRQKEIGREASRSSNLIHGSSEEKVSSIGRCLMLVRS